MVTESFDTETKFESSRIIVKNVPKRISEESLRSHFGSKGSITDLKLAKTPDGRSRGFAFIGFGSTKEAKEAVKYFDRTFIDTCKVQVELAKPMGDPTLDRPWSKYSKGSSAHDQLHQSNQPNKQVNPSVEEKKRIKEDMERKKKFLMSIYGDEDDEGMNKFVSAMKSKSKTKTWENDDEAFSAPQKENGKSKKKEPKVKIDVSAVTCKKAGANGSLVEQVHLKFEESSEDEQCDDEYKKAFGGESSDDELYDELQVEEESDEEKESGDMKELHDIKVNPMIDDAGKKELNPEMIADTGRLFIRNLAYTCTEDDLRVLFEPFGPLTEVHMPIARETKKPKGFAYTLFMIPEHALKAFSRLDGTIFQGRLIHILPSHEKPTPKEDTNSATSSFKAQKEKEKKEQSNKDYNWNSLFIRSDTILDAIAAQLGVPKAQIMDTKSDNLATRLAVAETHLVQETKSYLESQGVLLDAFQGRPAQRSDCLILVKNLPFDTEAREIRKLFVKFGNLGRVILPPSTKAIALVEFLEASEARTAFKTLAYSKFNNVPLYLEWAPVAALKPLEKDAVVEDVEDEVVRVPEKKASDILPQSSGDSETATGHTLYVTNINWSTPSDTLKQVFSAAGIVKSVKLATKKNGTEILSLGFGFVEYDRKESLNRALDTLQGVVVDGHALVLKKSTNNSARPEKQSKRKIVIEAEEEPLTCTKLIIRNVPFEATERELKDLFRSFSQLKRLRLPKKFNGQHRGFAFAEFLSHAEAKSALQTLGHTHLYGRHLVLEWAKDADGEGEEEEMAREKAAKRTKISGAIKRGRVAIGDEGDDFIPVEHDEDD